jgi:hypothetical protein
MGDVGTFPFGWVRGEGGDNWQIIWDPKTKTVFAEGALSKKVLTLGESPTWEDAKRFADVVISDPTNYFHRTE